MDSQREIAVEAIHLTKIFRDFWQRPKVRAVDDLNLTVYRGEVFGLLGPNGSGKSTALKMMLGLLFPTSGAVSVLGHHPRNQKMKEMIGFLPEETYLYRFLNAEETLDFYGRLFNLPPAKREVRVERLLEMVGLTSHRRRPLGEYSKGMARRIGLAQALINDPDLLFLDEPTSGLDPIGNREIKDLVVELKSRGKTVFVCSHLLADMEDVCDRIAIMYGGRLRVMGTKGELLKKRAMTRIETETLSVEKVEEVVRVLHADNPDRSVQVAEPLMRLEEYFLDVIEKAREEQPDSSGAGAGGAAGAFWAEEAPKEGGALIESLVQAPQPAAPEAAKPAAAVLPEAPREDKEARKAALTDLVAGAAAPAAPAEAPAPLPEEKSDEEIEREERRKKAQELLRQFVAKPPDSPEKKA